jgi:hypothetical protein
VETAVSGKSRCGRPELPESSDLGKAYSILTQAHSPFSPNVLRHVPEPSAFAGMDSKGAIGELPELSAWRKGRAHAEVKHVVNRRLPAPFMCTNFLPGT